MITVSTKMFVPAEQREAFEALFHESQGMVYEMPGFIEQRLLRPGQAQSHYILLSYWRSERHFRAWAEHFLDWLKQSEQSLDDLPRLVSQDDQLELHHIVSQG